MKSAAADDSTFVYGKLGYQMSGFSVGRSAISVEYAEQNDLAANGDKAKFYGVGVTQKIDDWGTELYAGFRLYQLDRPGASFDDIPTGMLGAMITF